MAQRRFGPVLGAGTVVVEQEGAKQLVAGTLGVCSMMGVVEKGPVGELIPCLKRGDYDRKCGGLIPDSVVPDNAHDFFSHGEGAGELWIVRVGDGTEEKAELTFLTRHDKDNPGGGSYFNGASNSLKVTAKSAGRWAGAIRTLFKELAHTAVTATTVDFGLAASTLPTDCFKGAVLTVEGLSKSYVCTANDDAGLLTFEAHYDIAQDISDASLPDPTFFYVDLADGQTDLGEGKRVQVVFGDGIENPLTEFSMSVFWNGAEVLTYENLSMDPASSRYVENVVNNDTRNHEVEVEVLWSGGVDPYSRPSNVWRGESIQLAASLVQIDNVVVAYDAGNTGDGTAGVTDVDKDLFVTDQLTLTCTTGGGDAVGKFKVASAALDWTSADDVLTCGAGTPYTYSARGVEITVVGGVADWVAGDVITISIRRIAENDDLVGGYVWPDIVNNPSVSGRIIGNNGADILVAAGTDLTVGGTIAAGEIVKVEAPQELEGGSDGLGDLDDNDFITLFDPVTSPINGLRGQGKGLVKLATPGLASYLVDKAGLSYAESRAYQYRVEFPTSVGDEQAAVTYINDTVGRNDFGVCEFPSGGYILDPQSSEGALKRIPATGAIFGREAAEARDYLGYHKAAAGISVTLPRFLKLDIETTLNEEVLNPRGINIVKKVQGNFVIWGDRTIASDPTWKWKHQREQMSHYELSLLEAFDWLIWAINDPETWQIAYSALYSFFLPEWRKRALRGNTFDAACAIKVDADINTDLTMAAGDLNAQVTLRLADTVERFIITLGKAGLTEDAA